jgi:hypothetical protein
MTNKLHGLLESVAWASVGFTALGSLGFCVFGVVITLAVEHLGWFDAVAPLSHWMLSNLHVAAYAFAASCVLAALGATGIALRVAVPVALLLPFGYAVLSYGVLQFVALLAPLLAIAMANLWWLLCTVVTVVLVSFAACTSPRSAYGYLLFGVVAYTVVLVGLCVYAVFGGSGFATWSPWTRLLLSCGIAVSCFSVCLGGLRFLTLRWPLSADSRGAMETWLVPLGGVSVLVSASALWQFAVHLLGYQSWLARSVALVAVGAGAAIAALLVLGSIVSIIGDDTESDADPDPETVPGLEQDVAGVDQ